MPRYYSTRRRPRRASPFRRLAQDHKPGTVSAKLRRQMGDVIADLFDEVGEDFYKDAVQSVKKDLDQLFEDKLSKLSKIVKDELGRRGLEESSKHFQGFMNELVGDIVQYGMEDITASIEDLASTLGAQYASQMEEGGTEDLDTIEEVPEEDVTPVEEVPEEEVSPVEEGSEEGAPKTPASLEDIFGGGEEEEGGGGKEEATAYLRGPRRRRRSSPARHSVIARRQADHILRRLRGARP